MPTVDEIRHSKHWTKLFSMKVTKDEIEDFELYSGSSTKIILSEAEKKCVILAHGAGKNYTYNNGGKIAEPARISMAIERFTRRGYQVFVQTCHPVTVSKFHSNIGKNIIGLKENWDGLVYHLYSGKDGYFETWIEKDDPDYNPFACLDL